jgi:hypothetical protein
MDRYETRAQPLSLNLLALYQSDENLKGMLDSVYGSDTV